MMSFLTVKNAIFFSVTFLDAAGEPALPEDFDSDISWEIRRFVEWIDLEGEEQLPGYIAATTLAEDEVSPGVHQLMFTPKQPGLFSGKASAFVGGVQQAVPFTEVEVVR